MPSKDSSCSTLLLGFPEEFQRAHETELTSVSSKLRWATTLDATAAKKNAKVVVLNTDTLSPTDPQIAARLKKDFAHAVWIAVSSKDSAVLAMRCLREGFNDFLSQPVSSEELALAILRARQKSEGPPQALERAFALISTSASVPMLRLRTLLALKEITGARQAVWSARSGGKEKILAQTDRARLHATRKTVLRCSRPELGKIQLGGVASLASRVRSQGVAIVRHAELVLMDLQRVERLKHMTLVDDLTGLYNSRYFRFALEGAIEDHRRKKQPFALMFLDLDFFKRVNDTHGHLVGSDFLSALGRILKNAVRNADSVFRYGGDEFVILLRNTEARRAHQIAERLRSLVEKRQFLIRGVPLRSTVSIGLAVFPDHASTLDRLVQQADSAMYRAKKSRNQVAMAGREPKRPRPTPRRRLEPTL